MFANIFKKRLPLGKNLQVEPVVYGGIIQLYHVKSGKFVTLLPTLGGKHDKESRRLEVSMPFLAYHGGRAQAERSC